MNYEQLASFVVFAEHRNFTYAAKQLHISQPALHVQIKKLADSVGKRLYRRHGRALVLTAEGERLAAFGREVAERGSAVLAELRGEQRPFGPTVLAAGQGALLHLLGAPIRRFLKQRYPLRLLSMTGPDTIEAVRASRAHLGVIAVAEPPTDLDARPIREVRQRVVVPAKHALATRKRLSPRDLAGEPLIVAPAGSPHRTMLAHALGRFVIAVEATGWEVMLGFASLGMGIAIVNDFCEPPRGTVALSIDGLPSITYFVVCRIESLSSGAKRLRELVLELA